MRIRYVTAAFVAVLVFSSIGAASAGQVVATDSADSVLAWNVHAIEALANAPTAAVPGAGQTPPVTALHLAMVHGAVYDGVNSIDRRHEPYLDGLPQAPRTASKAAAVATAAHHVLVGLVPALPQAVRDRLDAVYAGSLAAIEDSESKTAGISAGSAAAAAMLADRADDGRFGTFRQTVGTLPGEWRPTPTGFVNDPFAWVARVRPFTMKSTSQFRTRGPLALTSRAYARELNEVRSLGAASGSTRTAEQTTLASFYSDNVFYRALRTIAIDRGLTLSNAARLFAMANLAGADAFIGCWDDKAYWNFWRPITAIHLAADDGNPRTTPDQSWTPFIATPPYPEHPSGFNCYSGAYMHSAREFFQTNRVTFAVHSNVSGTDITYRRLTDFVRDTIEARILQGIHFRTADVQGAEIGRNVAGWIDRHYFEPVDDDDDDDDD